jgi:hypothetical protein
MPLTPQSAEEISDRDNNRVEQWQILEIWMPLGNDKEGQATNTAYSPLLDGSVHGELHIPRQRQHPSAHTAPVTSADQTVSKEKMRNRWDRWDR